MANYEATKYNFDGSNLSDVEGVNTGIIIPWGAASAPSGFLQCDGSNVSRSTYSALFAVVGTTYGSGDGSSTFGLPDLRDKVVQSRSPNVNLATAVGGTSVEITGNVSITAGNTSLSTPTIPSHSHSGVLMSSGGMDSPEGPNNPGASGPSPVGSAGGGGAHNHNSSATFTGGNINPEQASLVLMYIIKT